MAKALVHIDSQGVVPRSSLGLDGICESRTKTLNRLALCEIRQGIVCLASNWGNGSVNSLIECADLNQLRTPRTVIADAQHRVLREGCLQIHPVLLDDRWSEVRGEDRRGQARSRRIGRKKRQRRSIWERCRDRREQSLPDHAKWGRRD